MRWSSWHFRFAIAVMCLVPGCSDRRNESPAVRQDASRPSVAVTNYPLKYFAERIGSPVVDVRYPVKGGGDPAYWQPEAEDVLTLQGADLVLLNGATYETWLPNVSLTTSRLVDTSVGIRDRLLPLRDTATHSHGPEGGHEHAGTASTTWLDPTLATEQARAIRDALATRWSQHRDQFDTQFVELSNDLLAQDEALRRVVATDPLRPVVFSHPVYQYLESRYTINGRSVHWEPNVMPDAAMWREFSELLDDHPAKWMVWEREPVAEIAIRLSSMGVQWVEFDPCAVPPDDGDYLSTMKVNLAALRRVFAR